MKIIPLLAALILTLPAQAEELPLIAYTSAFPIQGTVHATSVVVNGETQRLSPPGFLQQVVALTPGKNRIEVRSGDKSQSFNVLYLLRPRDLYADRDPEPQGLTYLTTLGYLATDAQSRIHPQQPLRLNELCRVLYLLRQPEHLSFSFSTDHHALAREKGWLEDVLQMPADAEVEWPQLELILARYYPERPLRLELPFPRTELSVRRTDLGALFVKLPEGAQRIRTLFDPSVGYQK